jgi:hypothetical protein
LPIKNELLQGYTASAKQNNLQKIGLISSRRDRVSTNPQPVAIVDKSSQHWSPNGRPKWPSQSMPKVEYFTIKTLLSRVESFSIETNPNHGLL